MTNLTVLLPGKIPTVSLRLSIAIKIFYNHSLRKSAVSLLVLILITADKGTVVLLTS